MNKVVARYVDGRTAKGVTVDFNKDRDVFHVMDPEAPVGSPPLEVRKQELKALFFVKDLDGDASRVKRAQDYPTRVAVGRRLRVTFNDGEVLIGTTAGYQPGRPGFFFEPEDATLNTLRCWIVTAATAKIEAI